MWGVLFLLNMSLIALALGAWITHLPRVLLAPRMSRFLAGCSLAPFCVGIWMISFAVIWPGAPMAAFVFIPPAAAICVLMFYGRRTAVRLHAAAGRIRVPGAGSLSRRIVTCALILCGVVVCLVVLVNGTNPLLFGDILEYSGSALLFAQNRTLDAFNEIGFRGASDGSLRGYMHSSIWPLYLSYALIMNGGHSLGYPDDLALRLAPQATIVFMVCALFALAATQRKAGVGALGIIMMLLVAAYGYVTTNSSRDAFRITPLLLLAVALSGLTPDRLKRNLPTRALLPPLILSALALAGHTLSGIVAAAFSLAWFLWATVGRAGWRNIVRVMAAVAAGLALCSTQYVQAYIETGDIDGQTIRVVVRDGPVISQPVSTVASSVALAARLLRNSSAFFRGDGYRISVAGMLIALIVVLWALFRPSAWRRSSLPFLGLAVITAFLPCTGVFDLFNVPLSGMFLANPRYSLHWYPFAAVCLAVVFWAAYEAAVKMKEPAFDPETQARAGLSHRVSRAFPALAAIVAVIAFGTILTDWVPRALLDYRKLFNDKFLPLTVVARGLDENDRMLLEDNRYNYYLQNRAVVMDTPFSRKLMRLDGEKQVAEALGAARIKLWALQESSLNSVKHSALYRHAAASCKSPLIVPSLYGNMLAFILDDVDRFYDRLFDLFDEWAQFAESGVERTCLIDSYIRETDARGIEAVRIAIAAQRERTGPDQPWRFIILGRLCQSSGDTDLALKSYREARKRWGARQGFPPYLDELELALLEAGGVEDAASYREIFERSESPDVLCAIAFRCLDETGRGRPGFEFALHGAQVFQVPFGWQVPNEIFWQRLAPKTTHYRIAPVYGSFQSEAVPWNNPGATRIALKGSNEMGTAYCQLGWWLPERRPEIVEEIRNMGYAPPVLEPGAIMCYSVKGRFSSSNEYARLTIRDLLSSEGLNFISMSGTNWAEYSVSRVIGEDGRQGFMSAHVLPKIPLEHLPFGFGELREIKRFFPDEGKYAPVVEWTPSSTNAWLELSEARLVMLPPRKSSRASH